MYRFKIKAVPYLFVLPNVLVFTLFIIIPGIYGFYISFTEWNVITEPTFVFLDNYINILKDIYFWNTLLKTFVYVAVVVPLIYVMSLILALFLNMKIKGRGIFRAIFYLPSMLSFVVVAISWRWILGSNFGVLNYLLELFNLPTYEWLTNPILATIMVIFVTVWAQAGYFMVMFLAGLQGIPSSYYEAAKIDGASKWQEFRHITYPLLKPTGLVVIILSTIKAFKMFALIKTMTQGGPAGTTTYMVQRIYITAFEKSEMGYASAMSVLLLLILGILTIIQFKSSARGGNTYE